MPVSLFSGFSLKDTDKSDNDIINDTATNEDASLSYTDYEVSSFEPTLFDQNELSDLIRDLSLSKESAEFLASRLKEKKPVEKGDTSKILPE